MASLKEAVTVTHYIFVKQSILLFSLFTDGDTMYLQLDLVQYLSLVTAKEEILELFMLALKTT
jgi:alanine racemase